MPNYVRNRVFFEGDPGEIRRMLESIREEELGLGSIDFQKILPMPQELNIEYSSRTDRSREKVSAYRQALEKGEDVTELEQWREEHPEDWALGERALDNAGRYGHATWYSWCVEFWGTKWPALHQSDLATDRQRLCFDTAWAFPMGVLRKLSADWPGIGMVCQWADEDIGSNCGEILLRQGRVDELYIPLDKKEAVEYAAEVWETTPRDWGLRLSEDGTTYEYGNDEEREDR